MINASFQQFVESLYNPTWKFTLNVLFITLHIEVKIQEHGEKINRYQGMLAARLKAKYFSNKTSEKGNW